MNNNDDYDDYPLELSGTGEGGVHKGNGYSGISMSNNAVEAYEEGRMPLSKWTKGMLIERIEENRSLIKCDYNLLIKQPLELLKDLVLSSDGEYHHMGIRYNEVYFYHFDTDRLSNLTDKCIQMKRKEYDTAKARKKTIKQQNSENNDQYDGRWEASYIKRSADGKHKREFVLTGEIKGGWFFIDSGSELQGKKKLSISGKDFNRIRRIE